MFSEPSQTTVSNVQLLLDIQLVHVREEEENASTAAEMFTIMCVLEIQVMKFALFKLCWCIWTAWFRVSDFAAFEILQNICFLTAYHLQSIVGDRCKAGLTFLRHGNYQY